MNVKSIDGSKIIEARIIKIISNVPSKSDVVRASPKDDWRDIILEIEALCSRVGKEIFFGKSPLRVGTRFGFSTHLYDLESQKSSGIILELIENE